MLTLLKPMIEHRLNQDRASFPGQLDNGTVYSVSYKHGNYYVYRTVHGVEGDIKAVNINAYAEWFTDSMIDAVLAAGV